MTTYAMWKCGVAKPIYVPVSGVTWGFHIKNETSRWTHYLAGTPYSVPGLVWTSAIGTIISPSFIANPSLEPEWDLPFHKGGH